MADPIKYTDLFDASLGPGASEVANFGKAVAGLGREYRKFSKNIDEDKGRVAAALAAVQAQGGLLVAQATQLSALNEQERAGFARLQAKVNSLLAEQKRLTEVQAAQARAQNTVKDATQQAQAAFKALQNELREAYAAKDTARITAASGAIRTYKTETQQLTLALRGTNSEFTAAKGSYDALDAENKKLIASLRALGGGMSGSSAEAARLEKQIADNTQQLREYDARILVFNRNVGNYSSGFAGLVQELAKARAAQAGLAAGSEDYNRQQIKVNGFQTAAQRAAAQMGLSYEQAEAKINGATGAIAPLVTNLRRLETEQEQVAASTGKDTEAFRVLGFQIEKTKKEINDVAVATTAVEEKQTSLSQQLGFTREGVTQFGIGLAASTVGLQAAYNAVESVVEGNIAYSRQLAEVRKTTGLTADEADRLGASLKALDTPTSLEGLLKIASVGGQLNVAKDDLLAFTKSIDIAVQALANDYQGGPEEVATVLSKLTTVFRKELGPDVAQNILAIGSAVNQLGAEGAATAPFLTDVALRTGQASSQFNLGLKNALAYAAVLEETGTTAEVAGSSLNRLYSTLGNRTKEAYAIAQRANPALTLKEFTRLVNTDFNQAIQLFLKGLNAGNASTTEVNARLATLKLQSGEAKNAILALSQNTDLFAQRQASANAQLREASSLAIEAAVNTDTLAGSVDKNLNTVKTFFVSGTGASVLKFLVDVEAEMVKLVAYPFQKIGDGLAYIGQKVGLTKKPLDDYTVGVVSSTQALLKQADAQQVLVDSYAKLAATTGRSGAQELELSRTRAQLVSQFGTDEVKTIQASIDKTREKAETQKQALRDQLAYYTTAADNTARLEAEALTAFEKTVAGRSAAEIAALRKTAQARASNPDVYARTSGRSLYSEAEIDAAQRLNLTERTLAEQQRIRQNIVAALAKLEGANTQAKKDGADAAEKQADAEEQLDRAAVERAKNRASQLRDELADNQKQIADVRKYQAEQGKLFADKQLSSQLFAESVAGSEDLVTQLERDGTALRIKIVRAESDEKLQVAENDRIRQSQKKNISEAGLADIQGQFAARRVEIARQEKRQIAKINEDAAERQGKVEPLEFKLPTVDFDKLKRDLAVRVKTYEESYAAIKNAEEALSSDLTGQLARREITAAQYDTRQRANRKKANDAILALDKKFHKETLEDQKKANQDALDDADATTQKRLLLIDRIGNFTTQAEGSLYQIKANAIDAQIQNTQLAYDNEVKAAGENAELKLQIQKKYDKELRRLNYEKAKAERDQAVVSVLINTAVAIARDLAQYGFVGSLPFVLGDSILGGLQVAAIYSKPLPAYYKGRKGGPAEVALLGERGPELVGQEKTGFRLVAEQGLGYLAAGDHVYTAGETRRILAENELAEGRIVQRAHAADIDTQTARLRSAGASQQAAQQRAWQAANNEVVQELRQVRRAIQEQEYNRLNEQGDLVRRIEAEGRVRDNLNKRYRLKPRG